MHSNSYKTTTHELACKAMEKVRVIIRVHVMSRHEYKTI
jgi:hypothetical protein